MPENDAATIALLQGDATLRAMGLHVERVIGRGGSATVYEARDARHDRHVAVKVARGPDEQGMIAARFARELRVAAQLRHPHIMPVFASGTLESGRGFLVMPVAHGRPLAAVIADGPLPLADVIRFAREIAEALAYLHASGYIHRDIKPGNVLIESGHAVLTDFGLALRIADAASESGVDQPERDLDDDARVEPVASRITQAGARVGTLPYMSLEALLGEEPLDGRADIFSLGVTLYEMLTGGLPVTGSSVAATAALRLRGSMPSLKDERAEVPHALCAIVARCTAIRTSDRYQTAGDVAAALALLMRDGSSGNAVAPRRRRVLVAGGVLLAAIVGVFATDAFAPPTALDPTRVVVADLVNDTGDPALSAIGTLGGDMITRAILADGSLQVISTAVSMPSRYQRRLPIADSTLTRRTQELVTETRAGLVITGAYFRSMEGIEVIAEVLDANSGVVRGVAGPVRGPIAAPESALRALSDSVIGILHRR